MELAGRRVLVTGASRGIGRAIAEAFAAAGSSVALVARSRGPLDELAARLDGRAYATDLSDPEQVSGLVERVEADGGPVDVLVNNAGVGVAGDFTGQDAEAVADTFRVNLLAPVELCRQALPGMLARRRGHIVNISSLAGVAIFPGLATYGSSKAGLTHFTAGLRADLRGLPVGTTVVEVGPVPSDMLDGVSSYAPTDDSFRRMYRLGVLADVTASRVARAVVDAVQHERRHVQLPRRAALAPWLAEAPRRLTEVVLTGVAHRLRP